MKRRANFALLFLLLLWTVPLPVEAQSDNAAPNNHQPSDKASEQINSMLRKGLTYEGTQPDSARFFYREAMRKAEEWNNTSLLAKSTIYYSSILYTQGKYDSGLYLNQQALQLSTENFDTLYIALCYNNMATACLAMGRSDEALMYFQQAQRFLNNSRDQNILYYKSQLYLLALNIQIDRGNYPAGIELGKICWALSKQLNDSATACLALINLTICYRETDDFKTAFYYAEQAQMMAQSLKDPRYLAASLLNDASILEKQGAYQKLLPLAEKSLALTQKHQIHELELIAHLAVGSCWLQMNNNTLAQIHAEKALEIAQAQQTKKEEINALRLLSAIAYSSNNRAVGAALQIKAEKLQTRLLQELLNGKAESLEKKFETDLKNQKIKELQQDQKIKSLWIYFLAAALLIAALLALMAHNKYQYRKRIQVQKILELEKEKQLLTADALLKGQEEERKRLARDLHDGLGGMLSGIKHSFNTIPENMVLSQDGLKNFERGMHMLDQSIGELRLVAHNLMPENLLRFGLHTAVQDYCNIIASQRSISLQYHGFSVAEKRFTQKIEITLYRIIQELINNIVKHAAATEALVQLQGEDGKIILVVEDNGRGFMVDHYINLQRGGAAEPIHSNALKEHHLSNQDVPEPSKSGASGIGMLSVYNRVNYLHGKCSIQSAIGKGTAINIEIPIPAEEETNTKAVV